jgi:Alpha-glutamyl/putrescinyl thymine pyrophosphorylase clade 3
MIKKEISNYTTNLINMKNPKLAQQLEQKLTAYLVGGKPLPGISTKAELTALVAQMVDSVARINYVEAIAKRNISPRRLDPKDAEMFDPLRAAIQHMRNGNEDEAFWLVFLFVHCGKHLTKGYGLLRMVYGAFNDQFTWTWEKFSQNPDDFSRWLYQHIDDIKSQRQNFLFGNHRKYESLDQLGDVLRSYADWVGPSRSHKVLLDMAKKESETAPKFLFDYLYRSMNSVYRFGRTAKFDYLTMLGKIGLADLEPPSAYLVDGTGPVRGARLLFSGAVDNQSLSKRELDLLSIALEKALGVGMQVIEDSLCNWQKNATKYVAFRG